MAELNTVMSKSFYTWTAAYNSAHFSSFLLNFWSCALCFLPNWGFVLYTSCVLRLRPSTLSIEIDLLINIYIYIYIY
jgi:uncharacterized membrane protein